MKYVKLYWLIFIGFWLLWLVLIFFVKNETTKVTDASFIQPVFDSILVKDLEYRIVQSNEIVNRNQLLGYRANETEVERMSLLKSVLVNYRNVDDLAKNLTNINPADELVKTHLNNLLKKLKVKSSPPIQKGNNQIVTKRVSTNKNKLLAEAERKLTAIQDSYSRRKATLLELKMAVNDVKRIKTLPEFIEVKSIARPNHKNESNAQKSNNTVDSNVQELIFKLIASIQDWFIDNEIKSPSSGSFIEHYASDSKVFIVNKTGDFRLQFEDKYSKSDTLLVRIICDSGKESKSQNALRMEGSSKYTIDLDGDILKNCLKKLNKKARILYKIPGQNYFNYLNYMVKD